MCFVTANQTFTYKRQKKHLEIESDIEVNECLVNSCDRSSTLLLIGQKTFLGCIYLFRSFFNATQMDKATPETPQKCSLMLSRI